MRERHVAVARFVTDYEFNNTYQYVIAREDVHLSWLEAALVEPGGNPDVVEEPRITAARVGAKADFVPLVKEDVRPLTRSSPGGGRSSPRSRTPAIAA